jgi:myosin heavy subunit
MPKGSDSTFAAKLRQHHSGHPRFGQAAGAAARAAPGDDFTVQHYAGPVTYSAAKFLDKNRDTLSKGVWCGGWRAGGQCCRGGWVGGGGGGGRGQPF